VSEIVLFEIATIVVLGVGAQWLAVRLRLPSILLLLLFGFLAGPVTGVLDPDERFKDLLFPLVAVSVALILYEGGLTLRLVELGSVSNVLRNLITLGALITWAVGAAAGWLIFGLQPGVAVLLGALLVVTGPTVIGPLLRHIRPTGRVGPILKWEGIVIDPIGAVLAVLVFEVLSSTSAGAGAATTHVVVSILRTIVAGGGLGLLAAMLLALLLQRYWIPDFLQNAVSLMLVVAVFTLANAVQPESGLLAATVMGIGLANQRLADVKHIVEFKENLRVLLISALFILLAARLQREDLLAVGWRGMLLVAVLILVARPLTVLLSTMRSNLTGGERLFLAWMAPRGIVAAAVSSVFALRLEAAGYADARLLPPITFLAIIGTVAVYGLTSPLLARRVGVADPNPQGVLLIGAQPWAQALAAVLREKGLPVLLVDSNRHRVAAARMAGLRTYSGSILAEYALDEIDLGGLGRVLAVTPNDWVNALAVQRFTRVFGSAQCYQLPPQNEPQSKPDRHKHLHGRWLFGPDMTYRELARRFADEMTVKATRLSETFDFAAFQALYGETAVPMCTISESGRLSIVTADQTIQPAPGQTLVCLVRPETEKGASQSG